MVRSRSSRSVQITLVVVAGAAILLWFGAGYSARVPFLYQGKWLQFLILAYVQASLALVWMMVRPDVIHRGFRQLPNRERWMGIAGVVIAPLVTSFTLLLFVPMVATVAASQSTTRAFMFMGQKVFARESRGLVKLTLTDERGAEHELSVSKMAIAPLSLERGDVLCTRGRTFALGYVIDDMSRRGTSGSCQTD